MSGNAFQDLLTGIFRTQTSTVAMTLQQEEDILAYSVEVIKALTGDKPRGFICITGALVGNV